MAAYAGAMMLSARDLVIEMSIMLAITLVVAFLGPFGSFAMGGFAERLLYWGAMVFGGYALVRPLMLFAPAITARLQLPELMVWMGLLGVAGIPLTLLVWFAGGAPTLPSPADFLRLYPNVLMIGALVTLVFWVLRKKPAAVHALPQSAPAANATAAAPPADLPIAVHLPAAPRLLERLPPGQRAPVLALEMEDHYVRVHTASGSSLVLLRMRDAVLEMDGVDGMQVHRSWWVARDSLAGHRSEGRNLILCLHGGLEAPVSRDTAAKLKASGWL